MLNKILRNLNTLDIMVEESQSSTNSITVWLDGQPDQPEEYIFQPLPAKKRRACAQPDSELRRKRQQLMEISANTQLSGQTSGRKLRSSEARAPPMTPTSRGRTAKKPDRRPNAGSPFREAGPNEDEDEKQIPKAPATSLGSVPLLLAQPLRPQKKASDSSESHGSKKSRSQSPTKSLMDLKDTNMPIFAKAWDSSEKPADLEKFVNDMEQIGDRIGCIPSAVKARFAAIGKTPRAFQIAEDGSQGGGIEAEARATREATGGLGHEVFWYEVSKITRASNKCQVRAAPEPTWNSEVHSRVLQLALEGYWEGKEISYQDISLARLCNKSLVPWNVTTGAMQSKMVDYAIIIDPDEDFNGDASKSLHNHIVEKVSGEMNASINQTAAPYVRYRPIGVSIETKKGLVGEEEAHVQLGTWMIAQYTRLRQLMTNQATGKLPSFPVLSVHGQRWFLMIACIRENGHIDLIKELLVGDTGSFAGVYQVIAAIRRIAQWVNDDYRPWFEREILGKANGIQVSP